MNSKTGKREDVFFFVTVKLLSGRFPFEKFQIIHTTLTFHGVIYNFDTFLGLASLKTINILSES
jgi:hypothetical protein